MLYNLTDEAIKRQRFLERHQQATEQQSGPRSRNFAVKELQAIKQGSRTMLRLILLAIHITGSLCVTCPSIGCSLESVGCQVLNTVLKCSGKDITGSLNINNLPTNLETIYLNSNRISNVASTQFRNLRNLKRLYLSNNQLTHLALELFSSNQELEILTLGNNLLTTLDQNLFLPANLLQLANLRSAIASLQLNVLIYPEIGMEAHAYFLSFARLAPVREFYLNFYFWSANFIFYF